MSRNTRRRMLGEHFAAVPDEVLTSPAYTTLPHYAMCLLFAIAAQFRGNNNGDLAMTWAIARRYGINSHKHLVKGLTLLLERGLIQKTRQGGKKPLGPCLYAVTWRPINDLKGKIESGETFKPTNAWAQWLNGTAGGSEHNKSSGLPGDHIGTPGGPLNGCIGTPGGPENPIYRDSRESAF